MSTLKCVIFSASVQELLKIKDELTNERDEKLSDIVKVRLTKQHIMKDTAKLYSQ